MKKGVNIGLFVFLGVVIMIVDWCIVLDVNVIFSLWRDIFLIFVMV